MDQSQIVAASETTAVAPTPAVVTDAAPTVEANSPAPTNEPPETASMTAAAPAVALPTQPTPDVAPIKVEDIRPEPIAAVTAKANSNTARYVLLAASLTLAIAMGAIAGAAATFHFAPAPAKPAQQLATADQTLALKASVAQLGRELASVKGSIDTVNRSTASQFKVIAERLDRAEKAQVEPTAKLAKISESLERLERRVAAPAPAPAATAPSHRDVTGSVTTVEKQPAKPPTLEGWRVVDVYAGRAVLQSRAGALYEIAPGSNLPGVGRIEQIKREDGRIVVVTPKGIITAEVQQPRRQQYYSPYRY